MKQTKDIKLKMSPNIYYVWVAGSCDYGHEERCSGGAYMMMQNDKALETFVISDDHTTEFRMILRVMCHAMEVIPEGSIIVFLTNVSYIQQNWDKEPTEKSANADLIKACITLKGKHSGVTIKLVPFHKYHHLQDTNNLAHEAMIKQRTQ